MKMTSEFHLPVEHTDICNVLGADGEWDMEAVAAIVHAVNNHDKLVEALRAISDEGHCCPSTLVMIAYSALKELDSDGIVPLNGITPEDTKWRFRDE